MSMASGKCFAKGSCAPGPVPKGQIRLYSMRFCPFAHRARLVLHAKGIKHDIVNINVRDNPEWYLEMNPLGEVPTLETESGQIIYESPITCDFLDEVYTEKKLLPADPFKKAQQKMLLEDVSKITAILYKIPMGKRNGDDISGLETELKAKLLKLNENLANKKTKFFSGDSVTMIDYMMWPWFERLELFESKHCLDGLPELTKWTELMLEDSAVKATMHSMETHKGFYKTYVEGKPNYDYGL